MSDLRGRRQRRQAKAAIKNRDAKPTHKLVSGRTGSVASKKRLSMKQAKRKK